VDAPASRHDTSCFVARVAALLSVPAPVATSNSLGPALIAAPTAQTRSRRALWAALGLVALVIIIGGAWFDLQRSGRHRHADAVAVRQSPSAATEKAIAVLPFADMSEKKNQEYFADGMAEEILGLLAKILTTS